MMRTLLPRVVHVFKAGGHRPALILSLSLVGALLTPLILSGNGMAVTLRVNGTAAPTTLDVTQSVSFTCTPVNGKSPYTFSWSFGDGGTSTLQNPQHAYNTPGAYTANVTVTDRNLQTGTWTSGTITVNVLPSVTGTATPTTIDATQSVSFTCAPRNGTTPYTYLWSFGDGSPGSTSQNPSHVYSTAGAFAASVTLTDSAGKTALWIIVISVNPLPTAAGTAAPMTIDATQSVSFTSTPSGGTIPYAYSWAFGDGGTSALQNPSYVFNTAGSFTASVTVTDGVGKTASWTSSPITVNALPSVIGSTSRTATDLGHSVSFTCAPSGGTAPFTYSWTFGDGGTSALQNPSHTYSTTGTHTARVVLTDALGEQASWSVAITVNALPSLTGTAMPTTIDVTQTVSFTCTPRNGTSPYTYLWDFGDGSPGSAAQNPSHTYASIGTFAANVTMADAVGEQAVWAVVITVNPLSSVTGTATPTTVDEGQSVTFKCTPNYGTPPYKYHWAFGDGGTSAQRNPSYLYSTAGVYTANVTVTDSVGVNASWTIVITVNALPGVTGTSSPTAIDSGQIVAFTCTPSDGTPPYTYSWNFGGAPGQFVYATTNQSQSPFFEYENPGTSPETYTATVTVTDAVGETVSWTSTTITVYATPSVSGAASPTTIDMGQSVSFTCTASFGSGVYTSYLWAFGDSPANTSANRNATHEYDAAGSYVAMVTVTDSLAEQAIWMVDITVNALPTVTGTAAPTMIDASQGVSFTCTPSLGTGTYSYLWTFGDGPANTSTARNTTHEYDAAGSYIAGVTVTDSLGEQATWTVDVTVNPWLIVTGTSATTIDAGQSVSLGCTPSYGTTPYTYSWTFGDGGTSVLQNPTHVYATAGTYTSTVVVTDAVGGQASWPVVVTVNALPSVTGTATPSATDLGLPMFFTCAASFGTGSYVYLWEFGDGSAGSTAQSPSHTYASTGSYTANVTATDALGETAVWTVVVTVNALPIVTGTATPRTLDAAQSTSFTCTPSYGTQPYTYSWDFGDGGSSALQNPSHAYGATGTYVANVTATDAVGEFASWTVDITVNPPLGVTGTAAPTVIDHGQNVNFTCTASGGTTPYTYLWTFGDGSTSTSQSLDHSFANGGAYTVNVTVTDAANAVAVWSTVITVNGTASGLPLTTVLQAAGVIGGILAMAILLLAAGRRRKSESKRDTVIEAAPAPQTAIAKTPAPVERPPIEKAIAENAPVVKVEPVPPVPAPKRPAPAERTPAKRAGPAAGASRKEVKKETVPAGKTCPLCLELNDLSANECKRCRTKLK